MKKFVPTIIVALLISIIFASTVYAADLCESWSGEDLDCSEKTGGDTGGSVYVDKEGGYRSLIHEVNAGARPIKNFIAEDVDPKGKDITIVYTVKILSDDKSTAKDTDIFGFYPLIYGDDELINNEIEDALILTAGDVRSLKYDTKGWAKVYYIAKESNFKFSDYDSIKINNQVFYNGAKGSGCKIDMAISAIEVYAGDPRSTASTPVVTKKPAATTAAPTKATETPATESPTATKTAEVIETTATPAEESTETAKETLNDRDQDTSNPTVLIVITIIVLVAAGCGAYIFILKKKNN